MPGQHPEEEVASAPAEGELARGRALEDGSIFASYVLTGLLGSGGLSRVYRARHLTLGHEVALKLYEPAAAPGPSGLARFLREARLAASVRHPHVVQTQDAGVHDGLPFVVLELLEGRDLEARLRAERTIEELELIELTIPIVAALMALHAQGLIHGDLGPGNIFLASTPQRADVPKLLDIGITKPHRWLRLSAAARQRLMGSPLYMAPEAMLGHELTQASDQYSLGLILYECVTGVNPFIASSLKESVRLIIAGQRLAVLEQSVAPSPGLATIIERALSVDPAERFPDLASLGRALLRLADQRTRAAWEFSFQPEPRAPASFTMTTRRLPPARQNTHSRWGAAGVALAVLGWVTAAIVGFATTRPDPEQAYVLLGPAPGANTWAREPRGGPTGSAAQAPCRDVAAADGMESELAAVDGSEMSAVASAGDGIQTMVSQLLPAAGAGQGGSAGLPLTGLELPIEPAAVDAVEGGPALEPSPALSGGGGSPSAGIALPARGTNNAPIFD